MDGETVEVEVNGDTVRVDGETLEARLEVVDGTPMHVLRLGRATHRFVVQRGDAAGRYTLWTDGYRLEAEALDERTRAIRAMTASVAVDRGPAPLVAPMPGLIVRVNVQVGERVEPGQGLVVMEAMKMENELRASSGGIVAAIRVSTGLAVEKGAVLVELQ
ncbi:MAG TPA: biotin/lipoyl-containing protein [Gemmatimonadaceae bacterium]